MLSNICPHCGKDRGNAGNNCPHCEAKIENKDAARPRSSKLLTILVVGLLGINLAIWIIPNFLRAHVSGCFTACQSNEKNIGTALEMYSNDHKGMYPRQLQDLVPKYLNEIPTCPQVHKDTYPPLP